MLTRKPAGGHYFVLEYVVLRSTGPGFQEYHQHQHQSAKRIHWRRRLRVRNGNAVCRVILFGLIASRDFETSCPYFGTGSLQRQAGRCRGYYLRGCGLQLLLLLRPVAYAGFRRLMWLLPPLPRRYHHRDYRWCPDSHHLRYRRCCLSTISSTHNLCGCSRRRRRQFCGSSRV